MADGERRARTRPTARATCSAAWARTRTAATRSPRCPQTEWDQTTLLRLEKEALGLYVSAHPLQGLREQLHDEIEVPVTRLDDAGDGAMTWTGGIVANAQKRVSKNGGVWLSFRLEDIDGGIECRAWPKVYEQFRELLVEDAIVKVKGRIERRAEGDTMLDGDRGRAVQRRERVPPAHGRHRLHAAWRRRSSTTCAACSPTSPATVPVVLQMVRGEQRAKLRVGDGLRVDPVAGLYAELKALLGESCIGVG